MMNILDDKLEDLRKAATEQTNRVCNEVEGAVDTLAQAAERREVARKAAKAKRDEADQIEAAAEREYQTALTNHQTALISVSQQLAAGQMVTGSTATPQPRKAKPKLITDEKDEAA